MDRSTAARLLAVADAEVGTTESPPGSNRNRYAAEIAPAYQAQPWCALFVSWAWRQAGLELPDIGYGQGPGLFTYCPYAVTFARTHGQAVYDRRTGVGWEAIEPGDIVLFDWEQDGTSDHVGLVVSVDPGGVLRTVEGNTASDDRGDQSNGGGVYRKRRPRSSVICVWRPPVPTKSGGTIEEDDVPSKFLVGPITSGDFAGRYATVTVEPDQRQLRCILGVWEDGPGVEQIPAYATSILHLDDPAVTAGLGHSVDWSTFEFFRSPTDPRAFVVRDSIGDYTFRVAP